MRYLLCDKIISLEANKSIRAIKAVTLSEDFFQDHFPGNPILPGALIIEAAAQAGTALIEIPAGTPRKAFLLMVQDAKFRSFVRPGCTLTFDLNVTDMDENSVRTECTVTATSPGKKDERAATMMLTFGIRPASEFYSDVELPYVRMLYRMLLQDFDARE